MMSIGSPISRLARLVAAAALTVTVATAMATTSATPAEAAQTGVKPQPGSAFCGHDDTLVSTPAMTSDPQTVPAGVAWVDTSQKVAWRANLTQWDGYQWVTIRWGDWFTGKVGVVYDQTGVSYTSWTTLSGEPLSGLPGFWDLPSGSYSAPIYYMVGRHQSRCNRECLLSAC
jgi:hypothetical protein